MTKKRAVIAVALLLLAYVVFDQARWFVLEARVHDVLHSLPKEPATRDLLALRGRIEAQERSLLLRPSAIALDLRLEQHDSNGRAFREDSALMFWFVIVEARAGSKTLRWEQRIDNRLAETEGEALERGQVRVVRRASQGEKP
jgi:hypothetical protein